MKILAKILKIVGIAWVILASILVLIGIAGTWMSGGFGAVQELLSPFNVVNWFVTALTFAPGLLALVAADKLELKALKNEASRTDVTA